ncbi:MAG: hypothetical protein L3J92_05190 [Thermoplasmata archaeon]|jgi:hypothetical protein|nr:hypothetical protein [Thermoplasmata archaeon]
MPSKRPSKTHARRPKPAPVKSSRPVKKSATKIPPKAAPKPMPKKGRAAAKPAPTKKSAAPPEPAPTHSEPRRIDGRRHLLSLSFVRDGDEFLARMETDSGHITELKNRALDQLLTLVAGELEDLLD